MFISCLGSVYRKTVPSQFSTSIDSLLDSQCPPTEIVLVVDGPISDSLESLIGAYSHNTYFKVVRLSANQGLARALNAGLKMCSSEIVCRFDTDDINLSTRLHCIRQAFESDPDLDIIGSSIFEFNQDLNLLSVRLKKVAVKHADIVKRMNLVNPLNHPSVAFKKSSIMAIGGYQHMPFFEDYYLWLIARHCRLRFANIEVPLVCMRRSGLLRRRSGLRYALHEARFFSTCLQNSYISPLLLPLIALRILSRLMPGAIQQYQSYLPWRFPASSNECLELLKWLAFEDGGRL